MFVDGDRGWCRHSGILNSLEPSGPVQPCIEITLPKLLLCKGKGKGHPRTGHEGQEREQMYSSILPSTSGVGGQRHAPAALPPGKTRYPLYRRLGEPQGWSEKVLKISTPPGFDPRTFQPVASRYTDWAIPVPTTSLYINKFKSSQNIDQHSSFIWR